LSSKLSEEDGGDFMIRRFSIANHEVEIMVFDEYATLSLPGESMILSLRKDAAVIAVYKNVRDGQILDKIREIPLDEGAKIFVDMRDDLIRAENGTVDVLNLANKYYKVLSKALKGGKKKKWSTTTV